MSQRHFSLIPFSCTALQRQAHTASHKITVNVALSDGRDGGQRLGHLFTFFFLPSSSLPSDLWSLTVPTSLDRFPFHSRQGLLFPHTPKSYSLLTQSTSPRTWWQQACESKNSHTNAIGDTIQRKEVIESTEIVCTLLLLVLLPCISSYRSLRIRNFRMMMSGSSSCANDVWQPLLKTDWGTHRVREHK